MLDIRWPLDVTASRAICPDPVDDYAQLERVGRADGWFDALLPKWTQKPDMWSSFTAQVRALAMKLLTIRDR